jgi:hypothetical protein
MRNCHLYSDSEIPQERTISGIAIESVDGASLRDILVENITMDNIRTPIFVRLGHRGGNSKRTQQVEPRVPGSIEDVVIRNVKAEKSMFESSITGIPGHPVRKILLENINLTYEGGGEAALVIDDVPDETVIRRYPEAQMFGRLPAYGLYCRHLQDAMFRNVTMGWIEPDARPMLVCDDVQRLTCEQMNAVKPPAEFPVVWLTHVKDILFKNCTAPEGTKTFVVHEGTEADGVSLQGCDTRHAATVLEQLAPGGLLAKGTPVFSETSPGLVVIDAKTMRLTPPMQVADNGIETPDGQGRDLGAARCQFQITKPGLYVVWVRVLAPSGEANSFYLSIDRKQPCLSDVAETGAWLWDAARDRVDGKTDAKSKVTFQLAAGTHFLRLRNREAGTRIQTIAIVREGVDFPNR